MIYAQSLWRGLLPVRTTMALATKGVALERGLTVDDLRGQRRHRKVAWARQEAMYECALRTTQSLVSIGRFFARDHTTVVYGIRRHAERNGLPKAR